MPHKIATGNISSFIISLTGKVVAFGLNGFGQLGLPIDVIPMLTTAVLQP